MKRVAFSRKSFSPRTAIMRIMQYSICLAFLAVTASLACPAAAQNPDDESQFDSMFNGQNFFGWRFSESSALPDKLPDNWKVEDGVIKLSGGGSPHLASQWDYEDFDFRFQWRSVKDGYNSGLFIRSGRKVGANQLNLAKGNEGNFLGGKLPGAKPVPDLQKPPKEWNEWRVLAKGDHVTFWCNGKLAWEGSGLKPPRGYIGLQAEGAAMEYRKLRILELGYEDACDALKWKTDDSDTWKFINNNSDDTDDDVLLADGQPSLIQTNFKQYQDYIIRFEYLAPANAQAGVTIRGDQAPKARVEIGNPTDGSGGIPGYNAKAKSKMDNPPDQWNYMEVRLVDNKISVWLNGTWVSQDVSVKDDPNFPPAGSIGLDQRGPPIKFRNLRINALNPK
jgi:hypothetical protein